MTEIQQESEEMIEIKNIISQNFKPIEEAFNDQDVTDICIDRYDKIILYKNGLQVPIDLKFDSDEDLETALLLLSNTLTQDQFTALHPIMDGKMPDGSRISASHKICSPQGTSATIRLHRPFKYKIQDYVDCGAIDEKTRDYLIDAVEKEKNILISGSTGSWKTTLLNILASMVPDDKRILICEDTSEIKINKISFVSLESPARTDDKMDLITLPDLVNHTFRRRPDRLIVGEIRTPEAAAAVYRSLTSGHDGLLTSLHSRSCKTAFDIMAGYAASFWGNVRYEVIERNLMDSLDIIIHMKKHETNKGLRYIDEMLEVSVDGFKTIIKKH